MLPAALPSAALSAGCALGIVVLTASPAVGQETIAGAEHVHWPLIEIVLVPDSCDGVWVLAAPNLATRDWDRRNGLIRISTDPVLLLQWAETARTLAHAPDTTVDRGGPRFRTTPRLQGRPQGPYALLARSTKPAPFERRLQLILVDSVEKTQWKTSASPDQVDRLLAAAELVATRAMPLRAPADSTLITEENAPGIERASIVDIPAPHYPSELRRNYQQGSVWTAYIIGADGAVEPGSIRVLYADHPAFAASAAEALARGRFRPARSHGVPVRERVFQVITFRIRR
jgi:hypothetical protein